MKEKVRKFRHMTWEDRLRIEALKNAGHSYRFIAKQVGFSVSAVYTEVQRGLYWHKDGQTWIDEQRYSATVAQENADYRATAKGTGLKLGKNYEYVEYVSSKILAGWSPDSIVGDLVRRGQWTVSTPTPLSLHRCRIYSKRDELHAIRKEQAEKKLQESKTGV